MSEEFKTWAVVEVMGHIEYAGFVSSENIAGAPMLRIDVPQTEYRPAFTKYISPGALYGITPCTEETARERAIETRATPFSSWGIENQILGRLRDQGLLIEHKRDVTPPPRDYDEAPF